MNKENNKEIDLRSILVNELDYKPLSINLSSLFKENSLEYKNLGRQFNQEYLWTSMNATYYIESLLLGCQTNPIILYRNQNNTLEIVDGLQRYLTLKKFVNNELTLVESGLKKLSFLKGRKMSNLPETFQKYVKNKLQISTIVYSTKILRELSFEEEDEIKRQLYIRYNTGIELKEYQIQKAQYIDDEITYLMKALINDKMWYSYFEELYIIPKTKDDEIVDKTMMKIRNMLCSTYSNVFDYLRCFSNRLKSENLYTPYLKTYDHEQALKIVENFKDNILFLIDMIKNTNYSKYDNLHTFEFIEVTYWLISSLKEKNLKSLDSFNIYDYVEFCRLKDVHNSYFTNKKSHYKKTIKERFELVASFASEYYGIVISFEPELKKNDKSKNEIVLYEDLKRIQYAVVPGQINVEDLVKYLEDGTYIVHPPYQRPEQKNLRLSSGLVESNFIGIAIPNILLYERKDGVSEVVDGQQRCLSYSGFLGRPYCDDTGSLKDSTKKDFPLTGLKIYSELNGSTNQQLDGSLKQKILGAPIFVSVISENGAGGNKRFDAIEHFVRLNQNISPLKNHSFLMWNVACDRWVIQAIQNLTKKHMGKTLKTANPNMKNQQIITNMACVADRYEKFIIQVDAHDKKMSEILVNASQITNWLNAITAENRVNYFDSLNRVDEFLEKINNWLVFNKLEIHDVFMVKQYTRSSLKNYIYLYILLSDISLDFLKRNGQQVLKILNQFYVQIHKREIEKTEEEQNKKDQDYLEEYRLILKRIYSESY